MDSPFPLLYLYPHSFTHLPPSCCSAPAGGAMGAHESILVSVLPQHYQHPFHGQEQQIIQKLVFGSGLEETPKLLNLKKKSLWSVCDLRVPKGSFHRIISSGNFTGEGFRRKRHVSDRRVSPLLNSKSLLWRRGIGEFFNETPIWILLSFIL